ncbi:MAG: hypothetical protein KF764_19845 [Labilithrix sp.]|nr:hypothetical protein [Labilithrix sp.]MBX3222833.1 hypothetical protein [Labilithrix sp.]
MLEQLWIDVERAIVAASLGELTPEDARERMCGALSKQLGVSCVLVEGHHPSGEDGVMRALIGSSVDGTATTLIVSRTDALETAALARLARLFDLLLESTNPAARSASALHRLRNDLAAVQVNVEFVEMVMSDAEAEPTPERRGEVMTALAHAARVCRALSRSLRPLAPSA